MEQYDFSNKVKEQFQYLTEDYDFSITDEEYYSEGFGNIFVRYRSVSLDIAVGLDRGQVYVDVSPRPPRQDYQFGLPTIIQFTTPGAEDFTYIYPEEPDDPYQRINWQISRVAHLLRKYCSSVLKGEFTGWDEMDEWRRQKVLEVYRGIKNQDPIRIESEALRDELEQEIKRRQAAPEQRAGTSPATSEAPRSRPWWAFWRRL